MKISTKRETIKQHQTEILQLNNTVTELKNSLEGLNSRSEMAEELANLKYPSPKGEETKEQKKYLKN